MHFSGNEPKGPSHEISSADIILHAGPAPPPVTPGMAATLPLAVSVWFFSPAPDGFMQQTFFGAFLGQFGSGCRSLVLPGSLNHQLSL